MAKGVGADDAETVKWYHRAAEHGVAYAQSRLGIMYEEGRGGLAQDYAEAVKWYRKAGEQGHAHALYEHGEKGVALDYAESAHWFRKAARSGQCNCSVEPWLGLRAWPRRHAGLRCRPYVA
jgi:TPR repeat protein